MLILLYLLLSHHKSALSREIFSTSAKNQTMLNGLTLVTHGYMVYSCYKVYTDLIYTELHTYMSAHQLQFQTHRNDHLVI